MDEAEKKRRKRRHGSETRKMAGKLAVRYDVAKLEAFKAVAGDQLGDVIRECGDVLTHLIPLARRRGIDPAILLQHIAVAVIASRPTQT